jgi:chemotaxis protein methyltransferase WspC
LGLLDADRGRYPAILRHSKAELQALIEEVVVPESWFFRDVRPFAFLTEHVIELFSIGPSLPPFRVLSVPCAGGEEPYSIAMALIDARVAQDWFHIDAADVSEKCLAAARKGVFSANSFRAADLSFRNRHFLKVATGYVLDERIRSCVNFHHHNILDVDFLERAAPYDAIFCRNLLIYFDSSSRKKALDVLDRLLAPTGLLFLGHAEHLGVFGKRFRHVGGRGSFAYARLDAMSAESEPGVTLVPRREMAKSKPAHRVTHRRRIRLSEAINTPQVSSEKGNLAGSDPMDRDCLAEATRLADQGQHGQAGILCEEHLRRRGPSASCYYLLGVVRQATGDKNEAAACFEKAVYLDPRHEEALLSLALFAERGGDHASAAKLRRRAGRAAGERNAK